MHTQVFYDYSNILSSEKKGSCVPQGMVLRNRKKLQQENERILYFTFCLGQALDIASWGMWRKGDFGDLLPLGV